MAQVFPRSSNTLARVSIGVILLLAVGTIGGIMAIDRSVYVTDVEVAKQQPIQFSHKHHAGELGIACGYCHTSVEVSSFAGIPPTYTCMSCHSQVWTDAAILEPVRNSLATGKPLE